MAAMSAPLSLWGDRGRGPRVRRRWLMTVAGVGAGAVLAGCGGSESQRLTPRLAGSARATPSPRPARTRAYPYAVPPLIDPRDVYAAAGRGDLTPLTRRARPLVYVPNSASDTVEEIDQRTYKVVRQFPVGAVPQHVVPSYDLRTLWVTNDIGNSLTPINAITGVPGHAVPVADPYNMYFTPDGRYAIVMAEQLRRMDFRDAHTMKLHRALPLPQCAGVNHADFTANGRLMLVSCEFAGKMLVVDVPDERVVRTLRLPPSSSPQDVKLSPNGRIFYVADLRGGVWMIDARSFQRLGFIHTGAGAHGLYPSRNARRLFVSNRLAGSVSVISFRRRRVIATWHISGGGSPDMGGVSASGKVLWLSGRYNAEVYAINTRTGKLIRRIAVGLGPHGVCVWPQPGRYSLGHTGVMR